MKKIEVGEYVRISYMYNNAKIARIEKVLEKDPCYKNMQMYRIDDFVQHNGSSIVTNEIYEEDIIKHSKNLLDLLEVGDIVTLGVETIFIQAFENKENLEYFKQLYKDNQDTLKSIVTREQIKEMEYRIDD